jgi:hypothetical protein
MHTYNIIFVGNKEVLYREYYYSPYFRETIPSQQISMHFVFRTPVLSTPVPPQGKHNRRTNSLAYLILYSPCLLTSTV